VGRRRGGTSGLGERCGGGAGMNEKVIDGFRIGGLFTVVWTFPNPSMPSTLH